MLPAMRATVGSVMGFLVLMVLVLWFVLDDRTQPPDVLWIAILLALAATSAGLIRAVGFRTPAIAPGTATEEAAQRARTAFQTGTISRMAMAEMPAIAAIALVFVAPEGGYVLYLLGAVISLVLLAMHVLPSDATIARTQSSLERDGGRADLATALGR